MNTATMEKPILDEITGMKGIHSQQEEEMNKTAGACGASTGLFLSPPCSALESTMNDANFQKHEPSRPNRVTTPEWLRNARTDYTPQAGVNLYRNESLYHEETPLPEMQQDSVYATRPLEQSLETTSPLKLS